MFRIKHCREVALKLLYQIDLQDEWEISTLRLKALLEELGRLNQAEKEFVLQVIEVVRQEREDINHLIGTNLIGWKLERLNVVDRNILRLGVGEYRVRGEKLIVIDEMVRLAKKYGDNDSYRLVNAVLDRILE